MRNLEICKRDRVFVIRFVRLGICMEEKMKLFFVVIRVRRFIRGMIWGDLDLFLLRIVMVVLLLYRKIIFCFFYIFFYRIEVIIIGYSL